MTLNQPPEALFKSKRLVYRAAENSDDEKTWIQTHILNDPIIQTMSVARLQCPFHKESAEKFIKQTQEVMLGVMICLAPGISHPEDAKHQPFDAEKRAMVTIGYLHVFHRYGAETEHHRNAMIGISLADGFRGQGYGGEAIDWALDWAFQHAGVHRVAIGAYSFNQGALKLYRKLGFVEEGRDREALYRGRVWHDIVNLGMLEQEWEVLRGF